MANKEHKNQPGRHEFEATDVDRITAELEQDVDDAIESAVRAIEESMSIELPNPYNPTIQYFRKDVLEALEGIDTRTGMAPTDTEQSRRMFEIGQESQWHMAMVLHTLAHLRWIDGVRAGEELATDPRPTPDQQAEIEAQSEREFQQLRRVRAVIDALIPGELADGDEEPRTVPSVPTPVSEYALYKQLGFGTRNEIVQ